MSERDQGARRVSAHREYWQVEGGLHAEGTSWSFVASIEAQ